jgi:hypothetical protein
MPSGKPSGSEDGQEMRTGLGKSKIFGNDNNESKFDSREN